MRELAGRVRRLAGRVRRLAGRMWRLAGRVWQVTVARRRLLPLAALVLAWAILNAATLAAHPGQGGHALIFAVPYAALLVTWRRWPLAAAAVASAALLIMRVAGLSPVFNGPLGVPLLWMLFLVAYALGAGTGVAAGLAATAALAGCAEIAGQVFNPLGLMITVGPWLVGRMVLSRRRMTEQLLARNEELRAERELFAVESVRYERARIARDLHDIVAHCLSVIVVQASAGQRVAVAGDGRSGMARALESVAEAAAQAQTEVGRLVGLLGGEPPSPALSPAGAGLDMVGELVHRASLTGLAVSCRYLGPCDQLSPAASEVAYRLVQEALTNALKHAPGAPVEITIDGQDGTVAVDIVNAAPPGRPSGLEGSGGRYGLAGMRERVTACGGSLSHGPTAAGGWRVTALLPVPGPVPGVGPVPEPLLGMEPAGPEPVSPES
jgi:signal transduction histidine kinase